VRLLAALGAVTCLLASCTACTADRDQPERPGEPCETDRDCNVDAPPCGSQRLCIVGRCEGKGAQSARALCGDASD